MVRKLSPILIPSTVTQLTINKLRSSAVTKNKKGEIGHPCLVAPLVWWVPGRGVFRTLQLCMLEQRGRKPSLHSAKLQDLFSPYRPTFRLLWWGGGSKKCWWVTNCYYDDIFFVCLPVYDANPEVSMADSPWFHRQSSNGNYFSELMKKTNYVANKLLISV